MPDLFDLWSSQTIGTDLKPAPISDPFVGLSDINTSTDFKLQLFPTPLESKEQATKDLFELQLQKVLQAPTTNAPLYTYGDLEARRYDKDGMQFTPGKLITGFDIEDYYSKNQSTSEQLFNVGVKTAANILGTFASAFLSIPKQIDLARSGRQDDIIAAFTEDSMPGWIQNSLMAFEDKFPNYYTQWERDHPYMSAAAPLLGQAGFVNFWGDKVLKNIGFSVGALGAGMVQSAAIEYATGALGTPLAIAKLGSTISRIVPNLFRGFRNLAKVSQTASAVDDVIGVARVGEKFDDAVRTAAAAQKIGKVGKLALTSYLTAQGEAYIEGFHTYHQVREDYYKKLLNGEIDPKEAANIEGYAQDAGRLTTKMNLPILLVSNILQFPRLLGVKAAGDELIEKFLSMQTTNQGWKVVKNYTKKKAAKNFFYESVSDMATEAAEEGLQAITSGAIHDYYMDKFSPMRSTYEHYIAEQLKDDELYQEMFLGGLSGFLMSGPVTYRKYFSGANARLDKAIEHMTPVVEKFNEHIRGAQAALEIVDLESDEGQQQLAKLKSMFNMVATGRKTGTYDMVMDSIRDLKTMDLEEINTAFNRKFKTTAERDQYVDTMISEMEDMNASIDATDTVFGENPYKVDGKIKQKLKSAFNVKEDNELNNIQAYLFNEFKTTMAFNAVRTKRMAAQYDNYVEGLKSAGIGPQGIEYLINFARGDKKVMEPYRAYKATQLNALQSELEYLKEMQSKSKGSTVEGATSLDYQRKIEAIQEKINMTTKNMEELEKLAKPLTRMTPENQEETKDIRQRILDILVKEEIPILEQLEYQAEREKQIEEIKKKAEEAAETVKTKEEYDAERNNPEETAEKIADKEIEASDKSAPPATDVVAEDTKDKSLWVNEFKKGEKIYLDGFLFIVTDIGLVPTADGPLTKALFLDSDIEGDYPFTLIKMEDKYGVLMPDETVHPLKNTVGVRSSNVIPNHLIKEVKLSKTPPEDLDTMPVPPPPPPFPTEPPGTPSPTAPPPPEGAFPTTEFPFETPADEPFPESPFPPTASTTPTPPPPSRPSPTPPAPSPSSPAAVDINQQRKDLGLDNVLNIYPPVGNKGYGVKFKGTKYEVKAKYTRGGWDIELKQNDGTFANEIPETGQMLNLSSEQAEEMVAKFVPQELLDLIKQEFKITDPAAKQKFREEKLKKYEELYRKEFLEEQLAEAKSQLKYYETGELEPKEKKNQANLIKQQKELIANYEKELSDLNKKPGPTTQGTPVSKATEDEPIVEDDIEAKKADIESKTKEELFPIGSLHKGKESGDTLKVIGYTKDGVRFEIQTEGTLKPTRNVILSELKRLIKEGKLTSDVYAELDALESLVSDIEAKKADIERRRQETIASIREGYSFSKTWNYTGQFSGQANQFTTYELYQKDYTKDQVIAKINARYDEELAALEKSKKEAQPQQPTLKPGESSVTIGTEEFSLEEIMKHEGYYFVGKGVTKITTSIPIYFIKDGKVFKRTLINNQLRDNGELSNLNTIKSLNFKQAIISSMNAQGTLDVQSTLQKEKPMPEAAIDKSALIKQFLKEENIPGAYSIEQDLLNAINDDLIDLSCE